MRVWSLKFLWMLELDAFHQQPVPLENSEESSIKPGAWRRSFHEVNSSVAAGVCRLPLAFPNVHRRYFSRPHQGTPRVKNLAGVPPLMGLVTEKTPPEPNALVDMTVQAEMGMTRLVVVST
jgi:hypothetical protein